MWYYKKLCYYYYFTFVLGEKEVPILLNNILATANFYYTLKYKNKTVTEQKWFMNLIWLYSIYDNIL